MLERGVRASAETSRRLACDSSRVTMTHGPDGRLLSVGRRTRTIPPSLRRALNHRDAGCRFPGCGLRFCDAHHVKHLADGGETRLDNLVLLCRRHHRTVRGEGFRWSSRTPGSPASTARTARPCRTCTGAFAP
jgi:5-methylcytosine-specific restriction endonuclease McrA